MENLETLGAIRVNQFGRFKPIEEYYMQMLDGIVVIGIKKDSENYYTAKNLAIHFWLLWTYLEKMNCFQVM